MYKKLQLIVIIIDNHIKKRIKDKVTKKIKNIISFDNFF